jgi:uncharacterized Zn-binding protein involved in type VI secretion
MARRIAVLGDTSSHGGSVISAGGKFRIGGKWVVVDGDVHACPKRHHGITPISGTGSVKSGGRRAVVDGDSAACGASINASSSVGTK